MGSPGAVESLYNESGAQPLTLSGWERLEPAPRLGFGGRAPPCGAAREAAAEARRALAERGGSARLRDMAHNKIPPRWLHCPRRGQPVAGNPPGVFESPHAPAAAGWAVRGAQLSVLARLLAAFRDRDVPGGMELRGGVLGNLDPRGGSVGGALVTLQLG